MTTTGVPAVADVRTLPAYDGAPGTVPQDWADENGHMNISHYFRLASHATWHRMRDLGMSEDYIGTRGHSFFVVEHRIRYLAELRPGQAFTVHGGLVGLADKVLHGAAFVLDAEHDRVACTFEALYVHVSMATRRAASVPADLRAAFTAEIDAHAPWLAPVAQGLQLR
ncbi:acyl-CoA thioesterase [Nocardioides korecus]